MTISNVLFKIAANGVGTVIIGCIMYLLTPGILSVEILFGMWFGMAVTHPLYLGYTKQIQAKGQRNENTTL